MGIVSTKFDLNTILVRRTSLSFDEAIHVWKVRLSGEKQHVIAAMFGTNSGRIAEVLTGAVHLGAKEEAIARLSKQ